MLSTLSVQTLQTSGKKTSSASKKNYPPAHRAVSARKTPFLFISLGDTISLLKSSFIMAGVKRAVDGSEERNGKRSKTKEVSASKSKPSAPVKKPSSGSKKDSKKESKSSKSDKKKPPKKVQKEESESEDDFDIDDVSDED